MYCCSPRSVVMATARFPRKINFYRTSRMLCRCADRRCHSIQNIIGQVAEVTNSHALPYLDVIIYPVWLKSLHKITGWDQPHAHSRLPVAGNTALGLHDRFDKMQISGITHMSASADILVILG